MPCGMNLEVGWEPLRRILRRTDKDGVSVGDEIHLDVTLLPLLSEQAMREILREVLSADGWAPQPDGTLAKQLSPEARAVLSADGTTVTLSQTTVGEVTVTTSVRADDAEEDAAKTERKLEDAAARALEDARAQERARLARENLKKIAAVEPDLRAGLQAALNKTYRRALEQRARELGEVESVREQGDARGSYEVTITVKA